MRLTFNVLWFEDDNDFLDGVNDHLREHLDKEGFYLNNYTNEKDSENLDDIIKKINEKKLDVDLILMDYNLRRGDKGDKLIKTIRDHKLLTDIIFYSADNKFRDKINEILEGVYFSNRKFIPDKIIAVTDHILKKTMDLSNFRGLVMAETSELEELIYQIILIFLEKDFFDKPEKAKEFIEEKVRVNQKCRFDEFENIKLTAGSIDESRKFISNLESSWKARTLMDLINNFIGKKNDLSPNDNYSGITKKLSMGEAFIYENFLNEILYVRNSLAHCKESRDECGKKILMLKKEGKVPFVFTEEKARETRNNLKKYSEILNSIYETISMKNWN